MPMLLEGFVGLLCRSPLSLAMSQLSNNFSRLMQMSISIAILGSNIIPLGMCDILRHEFKINYQLSALYRLPGTMPCKRQFSEEIG
jgi:hypothetical protein